MTVPTQYQRATDEFFTFLADARDAASLQTTNQSFTMVQGVLQTFRRRLSLADAVRFAGVLPALVRAVFVSDWDPSESPRPFADRATLLDEVRSLRPGHNFSPDTAIHDVAVALRKHVDQPAFDQVLAALPDGAVDFWRV